MTPKNTILAILMACTSIAASAQTQDKPQKHYGDNIVSVSPLHLTERGSGASIAYERTLDKRGAISLYLPVMLTFKSQNGENGSPKPTYYFMPGVKFYPTGNKGAVKYALGPSLVILDGKEPTYYRGSGFDVYSNRFMMGVMINNYINFNITPHLFMSFELGFGASYVNRSDNNTLNYHEEGSMETLAQLAYRIGYRF